MESFIRSCVKLGPRVQLSFSDESRAKQSMRDECDINLIMARYAKHGMIDHFAKHGAEYGFASGITFHEAMNVVTKADSMFSDLPAEARTRFGHDPGVFLEFIQNPENAEEMIELGLATRGSPGDSVDDAIGAEVETPEAEPDKGSPEPAKDA